MTRNYQDPLLVAIQLNNKYDDPIWFVKRRMEMPDDKRFWEDVYTELLKITE